MGEGDEEVRPKLGRIRDRKGRKALPYISRVLRTAQKALGASDRLRRTARFTGARIGRGRAQGTLAATGRRAPGRRRVVIKTRVVRQKGADLGAARTHLRYIQRDGVTREGAPGELYDAAGDRADGKAFIERSAGDRHQFRFIVAAEDGAELPDLKPFMRDLMRQMENDLGTRLDWVAVDHFNTGHPHTHVVLCGKDERGKDLVIARDYIAHGMRGRASDLLTRELGPETELDTNRKLEREVDQDRFTRLDRAILRDTADGVLALAARPERDPHRHSLRMGRLRVLERMGLAEQLEPGTWRIVPELEPTLRRMGERGDIIKTMHRELKVTGVERNAADYVIFDAAAPDARVVGRVVADGIADELRDRRFVIVDGIDGRAHYVDLGVRSENDEPFTRNMIVEVKARAAEPGAADRTIAAIADRNNGIYTAELHHAADRRASVEFVASHVRRLEAMRRQGVVERAADGRWQVGKDYLDRAARYQAMQRSRTPVRIAVLSWQALDALPGGEGATWLDRQLMAKSPDAVRRSGFGADVEAALDRRRQWLIAQGLAREDEGRIVYARNLLAILRRRELAGAAAEIAQQTGVGYVAVATGQEIRGTYRRSVCLTSGRFAIIERAQDFTLVPWRPVLERAKGQSVSGIVGGEGISWSIGKRRGLGV